MQTLAEEKGDATYSFALLIFITLLFFILSTSYFLQRNKIKIIHETVVSILLGISVGLIIRLAPDSGIQDIMSFDHRYFFNLLLPPIILNSGYDLKRKNFFRNIGTILTFALLGTIISTTVLGVLLTLFSWTGIHSLQFSFLDCLVFGAILSSTDPVTILAIFHQLRVDPKLYAIIFGESILNDSVAIVLFSTLGQFRGKEVSLSNIMSGIVSFIGSFLGSTMIGVIMALMCALMLKHTHLYMYPSLESCLLSLMAFSSYLLSNGIRLSGIVSLLFCGITMRHYCYDNLSVRSRRTTKYMFRVLSQLSENFVFIYLGISLFTIKNQEFYPVLIIYTLVMILVARYISTIPLAMAINWINVKFYNREEVIPKNHQLMLWWAGLRGAIAFALSFDVDGDGAKAIRSTVLVVCVVSVIGLGGTVHYALERLGIKTAVGNQKLPTDRDDDVDTDSSEDEQDEIETSQLLTRGLETDTNSTYPASVNESEFYYNSRDDMTHWFMSFDDKWIKPAFTRTRYRVSSTPVEVPSLPGSPLLRAASRNSLHHVTSSSSNSRVVERAFGKKSDNIEADDSFRNVVGEEWKKSPLRK